MDANKIEWTMIELVEPTQLVNFWDKASSSVGCCRCFLTTYLLPRLQARANKKTLAPTYSVIYIIIAYFYIFVKIIIPLNTRNNGLKYTKLRLIISNSPLMRYNEL